MAKQKINTEGYDWKEIERRRRVLNRLFDGKAGSVKALKMGDNEGEGIPRLMNVMTKVKKHLKGGTPTITKAGSPHLFKCFDPHAEEDDRRGGYRSFDIATVTVVKGMGEVLHWDNISNIQEVE